MGEKLFGVAGALSTIVMVIVLIIALITVALMCLGCGVLFVEFTRVVGEGPWMTPVP